MKKVCLITGSTSGIGKAVAKLLSDECIIILNSFDYMPPNFIETEFAGNTDISFFRADISKKLELEALRTHIQTTFGRLDYLVANAGIMPLPCGINTITEEVIERTIAVNLKGTFWTLKLFGDLIKETSKEGSIVTLTSVDGIIGEPYGVMYSATKAAIISLTKSFARHHKHPLIRVNAVAPGLIDTPMSDSTGEDPTATTSLSIIDRIGKPEEIAQMVAYLLSQNASYITGQVFTVDGGFTLK